MAYTGFISDPSFCRKNQEEEISSNWNFTGTKYEAYGDWIFHKNIQGTALNALWGDLAEVYAVNPEEVLIPGTLVQFGGKYEITKTKANGRKYFGVISTKPGVILNKQENKGEKVALVGRVPVRVIGKINKFDKLTTSNYPGIAKKKTWLDTLLLKPTIGRVLQTNTNENEKLVETFVKASV